MARIDDLLVAGLRALGPKPDNDAQQPQKKRYSERVSQAVADALASELRLRGLREARPAPPGELDTSGAERRMAGGIGAKKVDVTWATEESGLLLGISIKSINFSDARTKNFQKNLTNRRGDMLFEAVTLHRRFPYAVLGGFFFLDIGAQDDATDRRRSTFHNAHARLRLFTGRIDPAGRDEQYEHLYLALLDVGADPCYHLYRVGDPDTSILFEEAIVELLGAVAVRNPDFYQVVDGVLRPAS